MSPQFSALIDELYKLKEIQEFSACEDIVRSAIECMCPWHGECSSWNSSEVISNALIQKLGVMDEESALQLKRKLEPMRRAIDACDMLGDLCEKGCFVSAILATTDADAAKQKYNQICAQEMGEDEEIDEYGAVSTLREIEETLCDGATPNAIEHAMEKAKQLFKEADTDGSGTMSEDELKFIFRELGEWSDEQFAVLFAEADKDSNGSLNYDEFLSYIFGEGGDANRQSLTEAADIFIDELYKARDICNDESFIENAADVIHQMFCEETFAAEQIEEMFLQQLTEMVQLKKGEGEKFKPLCKAGRAFFEHSTKNGGWLPWRTKLDTFRDNLYQAHMSQATAEMAKETFAKEAFPEETCQCSR